MARTLIGILQILLKQDVTKRAPEINRALAGIQQSANRLGNAPWGAAFERQLAKLKLSPAERAAIAQSYGLLARDIQGKVGRADLATWRHSVLGHFAAVRAEMVATGQQAKATARIMRTAFAGGILGGLGTYATYSGIRGGTTAAFEQQRQEANAYFAGLPQEDRDRIKQAADELSAKYGIFSADMYEVLKEASLSMPSTDIALEAGDTMARLFVALEAMFGREGALSGLYDLNKMADNAELNLSAEQYERVMESYLRAQQVLGKDLSPGDMKRAVQYARLAGKALSEEFLMTWLPIIAAETSGSDAGTQIRANFDQLIGGRASKQSKSLMREWGIADEQGELVGMDLYGENPILWANEVLLPKLEAAGVDTADPIRLGRAIAKLTQNRQSSDLLARALISIEQYTRYAEERIPKAKGLAAADEIRQLDPFAAATGMVNSLKNLSAALGEHVVPVIIPGMNSFAGAVETVAKAVRGAKGWEVGLTSIGVAVGAFGAFKTGSAALGGIVALTTAGPSLQTAAVMLQGAATSLGGGAVEGVVGAPGGKPAGRGGATLLLGAPLIADWIGNQIMGPMTPEQQALKDGALSRVLERIFPPTPEELPPLPSPYEGLRAGAIDWGVNPDATAVDTSQVEGVGAVADAASAKLGALNGVLTPQVDLSSINALIGLLQHALALQGRLRAPGAAGPRSNVSSSFSDYGVTP